MKIIWHGHSCFQVICEDGVVVFDPYKDHSVPGLAPLHLKANKVLCSHGHDDHNAIEVVDLDEKDIKTSAFQTYHDDQKGRLRGKNLIHILYSEDMRIVHLGDLGCLLEQNEIDELKHCDVLMIPVGGYYTIDHQTAQQIVSELQPRIVIPMHYRSDRFGYDVLDEIDPFLKPYQNIVVYESHDMIVEKNTPSQIAVLKLS